MGNVEEDILKFIRQYYETMGHSPSVDKIVLELGVGSIKVVTDSLEKLEKAGHIEQNQFGIKIRSLNLSEGIMKTDRKLRVFLCHASQDKPIVRELYQRLLAEGWIDPWLDEEKLLPGQEWAKEIPEAVNDTDVVIVCVSKQSVTKEGYVQKEISYALDIADEKPEGTIFIIPVLLEDCQVPGRLRRWQWLDLKREKSFEKLLLSLRHRAEKTKASLLTFEFLQSIPSFEHILTTYIVGDDLYEEIFEINSLSGEVLGTFGVTFAETLGVDAPKKVVAFQVWIWDTNSSETLKKIYLSTRAYYDPIVGKRLEKDGEVFLMEPKKQVLLATTNLQLLVTIADFEYIKDFYPSSACFERVSFELIIYPKI